MVNHDLQNYISQSRTQGITDNQIRQNLVGQGWNAEDVVGALGSLSTPTSVTTSPSEISMITKIILISIGSAIIIGGAAFGYFKFKNKTASAPASQTNSPASTGTTSNTNNSASNSSSQVCGELPRGGSAYYTLSSSPPADYPSDIPVYPNGSVAGYYIVSGKNAKLVYLAVCTDDSIDKIAPYFITNGAIWNIENPYAGSVNNNVRGSLDNGKTLTGDQGNKNLLIDISKTSAGAKTWIVSEVIFNNN